ncbi:unnamed protein product [Ostreobium quekettii]|uniref:N-acetyltransferase domain-containing protein n=1 Tax=Ostreobium quekettii TaxID=121088 RepID=A0A8S1IKT4_9CHLO|nr:unnamed protein product [Ostreobium quekettii]
MWSREAFLTWDTMSHFCPEHLGCLATLVGLAVLLPLLGRLWPGQSLPAGIGVGLALVSASGYLLWLAAVLWLGVFVPARDLPLEFCYVVGIMAPVAITTRSQVAFDFLYYGATSGVLHACITPVFAPSFPHPRFFAFWALHGGVVVTAVFAIAALGRRPSYRGIYTTIGLVACVLCVVMPVNYWVDANYFYLREKPIGSVQELLGPWPVYVTATMVLGLVNFHLAYLPFAFLKRRSPARVNTASGGALSPAQQSAAVDVLYEGFARKIHHLLILTKSEDQAKRLIPQLVDFSQSLVAVIDDRVCGVLFMNLGKQRCFRFDWKLGIHEFGLLGTIRRRINYWLVHEKNCHAGELNIQAITVLPELRNHGIGTQMLHEVERYADRNGYQELTLEVVDTNPDAKRLYRRLGFSTKKTERTWPFTTKAGFNAVDSMTKPIGLTPPRKPR